MPVIDSPQDFCGSAARTSHGSDDNVCVDYKSHCGNNIILPVMSCWLGPSYRPHSSSISTGRLTVAKIFSATNCGTTS